MLCGTLCQPPTVHTDMMDRGLLFNGQSSYLVFRLWQQANPRSLQTSSDVLVQTLTP